ncbi:MAG: FHA domain-containing protein [Anaerolineae bacterium]
MDAGRNLGTRKLDETKLVREPSVRDSLAIQIGAPTKLALAIRHLQVKIILPVTESHTIGRAFLENEVSPFVDLQLFGADELGVSRKHLRLWSENGDLYVEDLDSMNGTRFNGVPLQKHTPQLIHDGDQLMLGGLEIAIEFVNDFAG